MEVTVNGQRLQSPDDVRTVGELIEFLAVKKEFAIVEQNGTVLEKGSWNEHPLAAGDKIEIVQFVGGG